MIKTCRWLWIGVSLAGALLACATSPVRQPPNADVTVDFHAFGPKMPPEQVRQSPNADVTVDFTTTLPHGPSQWGSNVWWTDQDAVVWTESWDELGLTLARVPVFQAIVEPINDNADPAVVNPAGFLLDTPITFSGVTTRTLTYRAWFEALRDKPSIHVMLMFSYLPPWLTDNSPHSILPFPAAPYPPNDLAEYGEFVQMLLQYVVNDIGLPPERLLVEAMNEPDLNCGQDPTVPCFWQNWTMQDIADVVRVTHEAVQAVDPAIRLVGLAECCGTSVVRDLLDNYSEGDFLEGLSYHYYAPSGYNLNEALNRRAALASFGLPLYIDEYGSFQYLSEGAEGGLWHSWALPIFWRADLAPVQYPISEFPSHPEPYGRMGLYHDWRENWERKPAYWVYANFFQLVGNGQMISFTAPADLDVLATRRVITGEEQVALWVVNRGESPLVNSFAIHNLLAQYATLCVYNNLLGSSLVLTASLSGAPIVFTATLPASSSQTFLVVAGSNLASASHSMSALAGAAAPLTLYAPCPRPVLPPEQYLYLPLVIHRAAS